MVKSESILWILKTVKVVRRLILIMIGIVSLVAVFKVISVNAAEAEEDILSGMEGESMTDLGDETSLESAAEAKPKKSAVAAGEELSAVVGQIEKMKISEDQLLEFMKQGGLKSRVLK